MLPGEISSRGGGDISPPYNGVWNSDNKRSFTGISNTQGRTRMGAPLRIYF